MALNATVYTLTVELADIDRGVYESLDLRMAREPSESADYFLVRLLAYCLEYAEGISFTQGVAAGDEPAVWIHDLTGRLLAWIDVGLPDAAHLHKGSRDAEQSTPTGLWSSFSASYPARKSTGPRRFPSTHSIPVSSRRWPNVSNGAPA